MFLLLLTDFAKYLASNQALSSVCKIKCEKLKDEESLEDFDDILDMDDVF